MGPDGGLSAAMRPLHFNDHAGATHRLWTGMNDLISEAPDNAVRPRRRPEGCGCLLLWCVLWTGLSAGYVAALIILQKAFSEAFLPTYLARYAPQPLFLLPLALPLFFCLIFVRKRLLVVNLLLAGLAVIVLMPPSLGGGRRPVPPDEAIRILTWNVHEEVDQVPKLRAAVTAQRPQIVCLQEARRASFATVLPDAETAHTREVTTLTAGKIESERAVRLGEYPNYRWALETKIRLPQGRLTVLNVHFITAFTARSLRRHRQEPTDFLERTREARNLEAEAVLEWVEQTEGPCIVAGDFNTPPGTEIYRLLTAALTDAFVAGRGWGHTYPRDHPTVRIDHVLCGKGVRPLTAQAVDGGGSDHLMMVVDVALEDAR